MRAGRKGEAIRVLAAVATMLLVGCQVPGGSFGTEPLQTRFAEMTRHVVQADKERAATEQHRDREPVAYAEPVILAGRVD